MQLSAAVGASKCRILAVTAPCEGVRGDQTYTKTVQNSSKVQIRMCVQLHEHSKPIVCLSSSGANIGTVCSFRCPCHPSDPCHPCHRPYSTYSSRSFSLAAGSIPFKLRGGLSSVYLLPLELHGRLPSDLVLSIYLSITGGAGKRDLNIKHDRHLSARTQLEHAPAAPARA